MRILVSGATGFIGRAFSKLALNRGHEIGAMILPSESPPSGLAAEKKVTWLRGTLAEPPWRDIAAFKPEVCLHLAWIATPGVYLESPENQSYYEWSLDFVRRARQTGVRHVVVAGTCIEYRISNQPLSEDHTPVEPKTTYAHWKNELRLALERERTTNGFSFGWARVFYPYGVGEHPARLCSSIIQRLGRGEKIVLKTPESTKDYIYIDDLAEAFLKLTEREHSGTVNLGTGVGVSVRVIAQKLGALLGKEGLIEEAVPPQIDPLGYVVADVARLKGLGWQPRFDMSQGLEKLLAASRGGLTQ